MDFGRLCCVSTGSSLVTILWEMWITEGCGACACVGEEGMREVSVPPPHVAVNLKLLF